MHRSNVPAIRWHDKPMLKLFISVLTRVERVIVYSHSNEPKGHNNNLILIKSWLAETGFSHKMHAVHAFSISCL